MWRGVVLGAILLATLVLVACQPKPAPSPPLSMPSSQAPIRWPAFDYESASQGGAEVFRVDPSHSQIAIVVHRAGRLARFGHDHVVVAANPDGWLLWSGGHSDARADVRVQTEQLIVDSAEARAQYGLSTDPNESDIEATRTNMLTSVLDSGAWPVITARVRDLQLDQAGWSAEGEMVVRGVRHVLRTPMIVRSNGDSIEILGSMALNQTDFGIEPFSAFGGGLQVADELEIHFQLSANRHDANGNAAPASSPEP